MYTVPDLPYEYNALEPVISEQIMRLHHDKHHKAYVDKLNAALESHPDLQQKSLISLLADLDSVPEDIRQAVRNHGGGHYNHSLFWIIMGSHAGGQPSGELGKKLVEKYGSFDEFTAQFTQKAVGLFGSGWVWLTRDLEIVALPNQDVPISQGRGEPLLGLDVWEHAYYLDYENKRDEYIRRWWQVVDWGVVEKRFTNSSTAGA